jgi:formate transporter FocA
MVASSQDEPTRRYRPDSFLPTEMAERAERIGVQKGSLPADEMFVLAVLAGAFIALGAIFSTVTVTVTAEVLPFGITRLLAGITFCLGLILVVVAGAELFTGNNLEIMALASGKISLWQLARSWTIVYVGNFVGAIATAAIMLATRQYTQANGAVGLQLLSMAEAKCSLTFWQALVLGVLCNALVCLAVWLCYSARSTTDKILAILFPITAFVAAGFEHSVANMYFIPIGLFVKSSAPTSFWESIGKSASDYTELSWDGFLIDNLLPVTLGNILGGSVMVGIVYWFVYLRSGRSSTPTP